MPTTVLATALPYSLADDAKFQLTVFLTHRLDAEPPPVGEPERQATLADFPPARNWISTLAGCSFSLVTSLGGEPIPLRVVSNPAPEAASWAAVLPSDVPVEAFPKPRLSQEPWRTNAAHRLSDHAIDLHVAAVTAAPGPRPAALGNPVAIGLLDKLGRLDRGGPWWKLRQRGEDGDRLTRQHQVLAQRLSDALSTLGSLTGTGDDLVGGDGPPRIPVTEPLITDRPSPIQLLLDDPEADLRVTARLDALIGRDFSADPQLQMLVDAHALRRYYERPEQPQQEPKRLPNPDAPPTPRPARPEHDFHARVAAFGSTPTLLRRLGLAVDVVLDGMNAAQARAALAGAQWISVEVTTPDGAPDLTMLPSRRTAVTVDGELFTARSSSGHWIGGALPLADDDWVVLDLDPDASGLKLDQFTRGLIRQYAGEANGDPGTSAPGTLRSTGFAIARRDRAAWLRKRLETAEAIESQPLDEELEYDDLVRGIRVEVWDGLTRQWHSLHRREVVVTGEPETAGADRVDVLKNTPDVGFLQLSALNRAPGDAVNGYYLHEVVAGWDGWTLSAPRPGLTIADIEPPDDPDEPIRGAHITSRVAPGSLPRLRYGTSYAFRALGVDLAGNSVPQAPGSAEPFRPEENEVLIAAARERLDRMRAAHGQRDAQRMAAQMEQVLEYLHSREGATQTSAIDLHQEHRTQDERLNSALDHALTWAGAPRDDGLPQDAQEGSAAGPALFENLMTASRILAGSLPSWRVRPQMATEPKTLAEAAACADLRLPAGLGLGAVTVPRPYLRWEPVPAPALVARHELGTGEQLTRLVIRSGTGSGTWPVPDGRPTAERHIVPPKSTQLEAETAGEFDTAIGTEDTAEIERLYPIALAERGTLFDRRAPSLTDARATVEQPGISLAARPGADTGSEHWATLGEIAAERGRQIGEGQYVLHDVDELRLPYLPDPCAAGISLVFYRASGAPHRLPDRRALQAVSVPYPEGWPRLGPLRLVLESGTTLTARVDGRAVHVSVPPGEQVHVALSSTLDPEDLALFGLWRSHRASVVGRDWAHDQRAAAETLTRAAVSGWTWWLTPSTDLRLVHAVPAPVRPPQLSALKVHLRPPGTALAALNGAVDLHGASTGTLVVRANWTDKVDDLNEPGPREIAKNDVVVDSPVGEAENTGILYLCDYLPWMAPSARTPADGSSAGVLANGTVGLHRAIQTFADTRYRRVTYVPSGRTRYAEFFEPALLPDPNDPASAPLLDGPPVVVDVPSSTRPAAPVVLDTVPLLRWEEAVEPAEPFAWRRVRRSGMRVWLARPWYSSGDGETLGVIVTSGQRGGRQVPNAATSLWGADPIQHDGGNPDPATTLPLLGTRQLLLGAFGVKPGSAAWSAETSGCPVALASDLTLLDVKDRPKASVLGYAPEYDEASGRWFADVALEDTVALWPFVRLAVARYQPQSIADCELSSIALTGWVQPLPVRTLTVSRPDAWHVRVTLSGVVSWLRPENEPPPYRELPERRPNADTPVGDDAVRAARLRRSRTVRSTIQHRAAGAGDLEWETFSCATLHAVSVEESGGFRATWTGTLNLPRATGTPEADAIGVPGLRTPGGPPSEGGPLWRVLVEEHELLDVDSPDPSSEQPTTVVPRLVYADTVTL